MGVRTMLRCSLIAGVVAATVVLSACAPEMPPTMMPSPVETEKRAGWIADRACAIAAQGLLTGVVKIVQEV